MNLDLERYRLFQHLKSLPNGDDLLFTWLMMRCETKQTGRLSDRVNNLIMEEFESCGRNYELTAVRLGMHRSSLFRRIQKAGRAPQGN